ncbi:MAG: 1,6-anhydro-N-acetylmuramyl-L-alanine amidase AmpD [Magnetococcales bacterium]|nr:1,6-anhydro-N-acetylmuramyl-L-alanine amidase AmpD [Magnetococcales bacterium]NGZ25606.1 1,6-anhydro-N-acetylmuramyl-L-alanine amidase AmpD [Magnetococcales bacterium]
MAIELLVVHAISLPAGHFGGPYVEDLFLGRLDPAAHPDFAQLTGLRVAAHFVINRLGAITQFVPVGKRAWHAGVSEWQGRQGCNDFSIGVELEGDWQTPFIPIQYEQLARLYHTLRNHVPSLSSITGHQHIAPGRKWDPGPFFDWNLLEHFLATTCGETSWPLVWD